ncbi:ABC transporter permease [Hymenobacter caeli]|uniref:Peptide/nickel transport system permease protein n=1 Tax=Hymenobacter caeli TaxID=2735894 RepID=A0ABX2FUR2_9BACT|nr:ABC transporter permease [Hymenobacter caeli]NRT20756.1 peptide/nickel transport system permease protein [Hymenobacter caeli]
MGNGIFRRAGRAALAVWALASLLFLLSRWAPTSDAALGLTEPTEMQATAAETPGAHQLAQRAARQRLGLDVPLFYFSRPVAGPGQRPGWHWNGPRNQYHRWLGALLRGDLGTSFRDGQPVAARLATALLYTLPLTGTAAVLALAVALALAAGLARGPWWRRPALAALAGLQALPLFVLATGLLLLLANPDALNWFPTYEQAGAEDGLVALGACLLPLACLVLGAVPELALQLEASLAHEMRADYAVTARAKGLSVRRVVRRHALRNALLPVLPLVVDLLPALVAGAVVVETIFSLPGMGRLLAEAAATRDYPVLVGGVLLVGAARLLALLLADAGARWLDPRVS